MQDTRSNSTLELVVNEQRLQNMSQIDLRPDQTGDSRQETASTDHGFSFSWLKKWPARFKQSICARVEEAKTKSNTKTGFILEIIREFAGTITWILCFICTITLPIVLFLVGLLNLDNCRAKPRFVMTASNLFNLALTLDIPILTDHKILSIDTKNIIASIINIIFNCTAAFLYILSAFMVFTIGDINNAKNSSTHSSRQQVDEAGNEKDEVDPNSCSSSLYNLSFWFITLSLSLIVIFCVSASLIFAYNKHRISIIRGSMPKTPASPTTIQPGTDSYGSNRI